MFERVPELVNANAALVRRGRFLTVTFLVERFRALIGVEAADDQAPWYDDTSWLGPIDTRRGPLYLLTGEYDFSCTPADSQRTADAIEGARFTMMQGVGHFPMSENPAQFRGYLLPVLDDIRAHAARP